MRAWFSALTDWRILFIWSHKDEYSILCYKSGQTGHCVLKGHQQQMLNTHLLRDRTQLSQSTLSCCLFQTWAAMCIKLLQVGLILEILLFCESMILRIDRLEDFVHLITQWWVQNNVTSLDNMALCQGISSRCYIFMFWGTGQWTVVFCQTWTAMWMKPLQVGWVLEILWFSEKLRTQLSALTDWMMLLTSFWSHKDEYSIHVYILYKSGQYGIVIV